MAFKTPIAPGGRAATEEELKRREEALETQRKEATAEPVAEMRERYGLHESKGVETEEQADRRRHLAHLYKMYHSTGQGPMKDKLNEMIQTETAGFERPVRHLSEVSDIANPVKDITPEQVFEATDVLNPLK